MKALVLSNGELKEKDINNTLEELQSIVGGYIEIPFLSEVFANNEIDVIINEEGKLIDGLRPEIAIINEDTQKMCDIVFGSCIFASHDEEGNTVGLNEKQIKVIENALEIEVMLHDRNVNKDYLVKTLFI